MPHTDPNDSPSSNGKGRAGENRTTHNESLTTDAEGMAGGRAEPRAEPQLPHDIDESVHSQARATVAQEGLGEQAYADAVGPSQDTDRATVTDALYNGAVAPDRGTTPPRQ